MVQLKVSQFSSIPKGIGKVSQWDNSCGAACPMSTARLGGGLGQGSSVPHPRDAHAHAFRLYITTIFTCYL